ncbi:MAG: tetratricopeptide repeat protein [Candidatus Nealsonbacteria bacterium]
MKKTFLKTNDLCSLISKYALYVLTFLLPIFFLPWTANILDFNKQILLAVLVFISLFVWILKVFISGKFKLNIVGLYVPLGLLFLAYTASTIFSLWRYGSFWGWPLVTSESLFSIIGLFVFYFLVSNTLEKKEIYYLVVSLIASSFLVVLYGIFQLFGKFVLPFEFSKTTSFNTIGTVNALGIFSAVLLPLMFILVINSKRVLKGLFITVLAFTTFLLILINFSTCWWIVAVGSALITVLGVQKRNLFDARWMILPMFFLVISLFFIFLKFQVINTASRPIEVFLNQKTSFNIAKDTLKEKAILGSGPGTFIYDFSKYKNIDFNKSNFWNIKFDGANSKFLTILATTGILGAFSILALIIFSLIYGVKNLFIKNFGLNNSNKKTTDKYDDDFIWMIGVGTFISFIALSVSFFIHHSNLTLDFIFFLLLAVFTAIASPLKKEFSLKLSPLFALVINFVLILIFVFGLGLFILEGQRYLAETNYLKGIKSLSQGENNVALEKLEKAIKINSKVDLYWRELSQVYFKSIEIEAQREDISMEEINQRVQALIEVSVDSINQATTINPKNSANWLVRGFIYQNLVGIISGVEDWAVSSYEEAINLEPINPYYYTQLGVILLKQSLSFSEENTEEKNKLFIRSQMQLQKAIELKSDYAPARFQLSMVYQAQGKIDESIQELEKTKILAPFDIGLAFQLGLIYYQNKNWEKAQIEFERAVEINSDYSNALYFLGLVYDQQNKKLEAIEIFKKLIDLNPGNEEVKYILKNLESGKSALEKEPEGFKDSEEFEGNLQTIPID